jgi:parallel beta-helix repeat protein
MRRLLLECVIILIAVCLDSHAATITVGQKGADFYRIEAALDSASPGDVIEVQSGDYYVNLNITTPLLVLRGIDTGGGRPVLHAGSSTADIEERAGETTVMTERAGGTAIAIRAFKVTVEGFNITGVTWPKPYGTGEHNDLIGDAGIRVYSDLNTISNNTFVGNDLTAIGLWNCSQNRIENNTIKDIPYGYGIMAYNSHSNTIEGNSLIHNFWGIELQRSDWNRISDNEITDSVNDGINAVKCNGTTVADNVISRNGLESEYEGNGKGIRLVGSEGLIIDNLISLNKDHGIYIESIFWEGYPADESHENMIARNKIRNNGKDGIHLEKSWRNDIWKNNITANHGTAISFLQSNNNTADENNASKNEVGMYLDQSNYANITNNTIIEGARGIYLWSCAGSAISNNTLRKNEVGIALENSSNGNGIAKNEVCNGTEGINLSDESSNNVIRENRVTFCLTGLSLEGAGKNTITANIFQKNERGLAADLQSNGNSIFGNDISDNGEAARDAGSNLWDDGSRGNYYGSEDCQDSNHNGICDYPQAISGGSNVDRYPLAVPAAP